MVRSFLVVIVVLVAGLVFIAGTFLIAQVFFSPSGAMRPLPARYWLPIFRSYETNGERIYFTGTSRSGPTITAEIPGMHRMQPGRLSCAGCHGSDGGGGTARLMMTTFEAPDIRFRSLTADDHGAVHADHPPYTDDDIKRAITDGVDPSGEPLAWMMPRWNMSENQLEDLLEFLKTLE